MQFRDLKQQYQLLKKDIDEAIIKVTTDCNFISGSQVSELEKDLAEFVGVRNCVTCANGTDALSIAMMVWGGRTRGRSICTRFYILFVWRNRFSLWCNTCVCGRK